MVPAQPIPAVMMTGTRAIRVHSEVVRDDYELAVAYPDSYRTSSQRYPTLVVLDGPSFFGFARLMASVQYYDGVLPEMLVVGIGRPDTDLDGWDTIRARDYPPVPVTDLPASGGAAAFLQALEHELLPAIHGELRTDPTDTTLWGHSLGGLFALYALSNRPGLFQAYLATSPAVMLSGQRLLDPPTELGLSRPTRLFISIGVDDGMRADVDAFTEALEQRQHPNLLLDTACFAGCGHTVASVPGLQHGLAGLRRRPAD